jgi:anti-sigma B factor antagonist
MPSEENLIKKYTIEDIVVLEPQERDLVHFSLLTSAVQEEVSKGAKKMIWDLKNVSYINSIGIADLILAYTRAARNGCFVAVANLTEKVLDLLAFTKLLTVFDIYDSLDAAVDSMRHRTFPELIKASTSKD